MSANLSNIAVALVHHPPVVNRAGETTTTAITSTDIHDFARACAFYGVAPVYIVHPAAGASLFSAPAGGWMPAICRSPRGGCHP